MRSLVTNKATELTSIGASKKIENFKDVSILLLSWIDCSEYTLHSPTIAYLLGLIAVACRLLAIQPTQEKRACKERNLLFYLGIHIVG